MEPKEAQFSAQAIQESKETSKVAQERFGVNTLDELKTILIFFSQKLATLVYLDDFNLFHTSTNRKF